MRKSTRPLTIVSPQRIENEKSEQKINQTRDSVKNFNKLVRKVSKSEQGTVNIQKYKKNLQIIEENEESYLHVIARDNQLSNVVNKIELNNQEEVNKKNKDQKTPLYIATENGNVEMMKELLDKNADPDIQSTEFKQTPLFIACEKGFKRAVELLLNYKLSLNVTNSNGWTALFTACLNENEECTKTLIDQEKTDENLDIRKQTKDGWTPIMIASAIGNVAIVQTLIEFDIDCLNEAVSPMGYPEEMTPLHIAAKNGHSEVVNFLWNKDEEAIHKTDSVGKNALIHACANGHLETVQLIYKYAILNHKDQNNKTALFYACENGHYEIAKILLHEIIQVKQLDGRAKLNELFTGSKNLKSLIESTPIIDSLDGSGYTLLYYASKNGHRTIVKLLLRNNANFEIQDDSGKSALFYACMNGHLDVVELLLKKNAYVNVKDNESNTPLFYATKNGHKNIVEILLKYKASLNEIYSNGWKIQHIACMAGHNNIVKVFKKYE